MREIKFRVFHVEGEEAEMIYSYSYNHVTQGDMLSEFFSDCFGFGTEYMQFTGLKDKNGIEIYEGDVVRRMNYHGEVIFEHGCFRIKWQRSATRHGGARDVTDYLASSLEVAGTIHQHPELLEAK